MVALAHARRDVPRFLQQSPAEPPRAFRPRLEAAPVVLEGHTEAALRHAAIVAGVELGVFAPLAEGPLPAEGVADALGLESARLAPLLDALALTGLLIRHGDLYANAPEAARFLAGDRADRLGPRIGQEALQLQSAGQLAARIRGEPDEPGPGAGRVAALARLEAERAGRRLALALHLGQHQRLLEIGADGGLAIAACEVHPDLHAIAATSEAMLGTTRRLVEEAALDRRLQVRGLPTAAGPLLAECDAVLVWDVLQPRSAPQFLEVLRAASSALVPGARLHLFGWIRDDRGLAPAGAVLRALLGDLAGGPAREGEVRAGLLQAGFFDVVRRPAPEGIGPPGLSHIAARRA
jgi:hypothetical protein